MNPLVSICIPTYQQTHLLKENLDSILSQSYKRIEVLVSDDSYDDGVEALVKTYLNRLPIVYTRNKPSLGSPKNWNAVLQKAKGEFVLLLHHDDQFAKTDSLERLLQPLLKDDSLHFSFGRNETVEYLSKGKPFSERYFNRFYKDPALLIITNALGAPSNVLLRHTAVQPYDERFKWIVDVGFYCWLFETGKRLFYTDEHLIKTGRHEGQITNECLNASNVLLYEYVTFAIEKIKKPKSIAVFDFYWRLFRNNGVHSLNDLSTAGIANEKLPAFIVAIVKAQNKIPRKILRTGVASKTLMAFTYLLA